MNSKSDNIPGKPLFQRHARAKRMRKCVVYAASFSVLVILTACGGNGADEQVEAVRVDFNKHLIKGANADSLAGTEPFRVAVSSMISPRETFVVYQDLVRYIAERMRRRTEFKQRKTYRETNLLLERGEIDLAFICSGAYIEATEQRTIELLAVPVSYGRPHYQAYVITNVSSGISSFADLRGRSFAFTDPLSHTGYAYARERVLQLQSTVETYFSEFFFTHAHDNSIRLVDKGIVDGASVDGLIYDYLFHSSPDRVKNVTVIERSDYYGIPPIVVPVGTPDSVKTRLRDILFHMHEDVKGREILDKLMIDRFETGRDEEYDSIREIWR